LNYEHGIKFCVLIILPTFLCYSFSCRDRPWLPFCLLFDLDRMQHHYLSFTTFSTAASLSRFLFFNKLFHSFQNDTGSNIEFFLVFVLMRAMFQKVKTVSITIHLCNLLISYMITDILSASCRKKRKISKPVCNRVVWNQLLMMMVSS